MSGRWDSFSWFGREACIGNANVETALRQLEAISIAIINPGFNKQSGRFAGATQVFQVPHQDAEGDMETKLARLDVKLDELLAEMDELLAEQE